MSMRTLPGLPTSMSPTLTSVKVLTVDVTHVNVHLVLGEVGTVLVVGVLGGMLVPIALVVRTVLGQGTSLHTTLLERGVHGTPAVQRAFPLVAGSGVPVVLQKRTVGVELYMVIYGY
jgi:hypothetical protein